MTAWCDHFDLPVDQCAHCTGDTLDDPKPIRRPGTDMTARFDGRCAADCGRFIHPGDVIAEAHDTDGWCHLECTADPTPTGDTR